MPSVQYPIYQPYGTVRNSFQQMMGGSSGNSGPIQYNVPLSSLRGNSGVTRINPNGDAETPYDRINQKAYRTAERGMADFQAQGAFQSLMEPFRINALNNYRLTPYEKSNYDKLRNVGYTDEYALTNARSGSGLANRPNSIEGRQLQQNFDSQMRDNELNRTLQGYMPSEEVSRAYRKMFDRL